MIATSEIGGFFAAHAVCYLAEGQPVKPMLAHMRGEDRGMSELDFATPTEAVEAGRKQLDANANNGAEAALVYDAVLNADGVKQDALFVEMRTYASPQSKAIVAVPYTPSATGAFRVHKPRLLLWEKCESFDEHAMFASFFAGMQRHPQGAAIWNAALDETK